MNEHGSDPQYAAALERVLNDPAVLKGLESDPIGTLEGLGIEVSDDARKEILEGSELEVVTAAWVSPVVRVLTKGTRPVVNVLVATAVDKERT